MKYFFTILAVLLTACTRSSTQPVPAQTGESQTFSASLVDGYISKDALLAFQLARAGNPALVHCPVHANRIDGVGRLCAEGCRVRRLNN